MKSSVLLHGMQTKDEYFDITFPAPGKAHWFPWLQKQLLMKDIYAETPTVPHVYRATYKEWKATFERVYQLNAETTIVGHSCGGGFLVRWLSENKQVNVGKVILVAPWLDPLHDPVYNTGDFFKFDIDSELVTRTKGIEVFISSDDHQSIIESLSILEDKINDLKIRRFENKGHFCLEDLGTEAFPELLEAIL